MLKDRFTGCDAAGFESLEWLEDGKHPLDWNGPVGRIFIRFRDEDLDRPVIDHLERVARRHRTRIAVTDSDISLTFEELWAGLSGLAETIAAETKPASFSVRLLVGVRECHLISGQQQQQQRRDKSRQRELQKKRVIGPGEVERSAHDDRARCTGDRIGGPG